MLTTEATRRTDAMPNDGDATGMEQNTSNGDQGQAETGLVYIGDPMCSWCWGFASVLETLREEFDLPVEVIVGGLRPGPEAAVLDDRMRGFLRTEWSRIQETTGQAFDFSALDRVAWTYDTELPAMAVTTMRAVDPAGTLSFFVRLQRAFYAEAIDVTDPDVYPAIAAEFGIDGASFVKQMLTEDAKAAAWADFARARDIGISGFPALLVRVGSRYRLITYGYKPVSMLRPIVQSALSTVR